jgi:hypothetical protein
VFNDLIFDFVIYDISHFHNLQSRYHMFCSPVGDSSNPSIALQLSRSLDGIKDEPLSTSVMRPSISLFHTLQITSLVLPLQHESLSILPKPLLHPLPHRSEHYCINLRNRMRLMEQNLACPSPLPIIRLKGNGRAAAVTRCEASVCHCGDEDVPIDEFRTFVGVGREHARKDCVALLFDRKWRGNFLFFGLDGELRE